MKIRLGISIALLALLAFVSLTWPVYRAFLNVEITQNEGWNAYFADAAFGRTALYPSRDRLIVNNYPPLSFPVVGGFGRLVGDNVLAGRLVSLAALAVIAGGVAVAIRRLGGDGTAAAVGTLYFVATMSRFFTSYVGMNDPHLLGQAVMTFGFLGLLRAIERDRGYAWPILTMVAAGFVKHNLIVMPITGMALLALRRPRQAVKSGLLAAVAIAVGFGLCRAAFGADFFANLTSPRAFHWKHAVGAIGHLQWVAVGLIAWLYVAATRWSEPSVRTCTLLIGIALAGFFLQKTGDGVAYNAQFELVFGVSIGVGLAFAEAPRLPLARRMSPDALRGAFVLAICLRLLASARLEPVRLWIDRGFHAEIAEREAAMTDVVARIRAIPGDVHCRTSLACYRAGKPFVIDEFNTHQRILAGELSADVIDRLVASGRLTIVDESPLLHWYASPGGAR